MFRKFLISNRRPNRYFPKIDVGCPGPFNEIQQLITFAYNQQKLEAVCYETFDLKLISYYTFPYLTTKNAVSLFLYFIRNVFLFAFSGERYDSG